MHSCWDFGGPFPVRRVDPGGSGDDCTGGCPFVRIRQSLVLADDLGCLRRRWFMDCSNCWVLVVCEYSSRHLGGDSRPCLTAVLRWRGLSGRNGGGSVDRCCLANVASQKTRFSCGIASLPGRCALARHLRDVLAANCAGRVALWHCWPRGQRTPGIFGAKRALKHRPCPTSQAASPSRRLSCAGSSSPGSGC